MMNPQAVAEAKEQEEDFDNWGVWDKDENHWVKDYRDFGNVLHRRQHMHINHAENAAHKMNGYYSDRYEARNMNLPVEPVRPLVATTFPVSIRSEIAKRKEMIAKLQEEVTALEAAEKILSDARS